MFENRPMRPRFLPLIAALFLLFLTFSTQAAPPNIIMILADDLGWGDVGFNGRTEWKTPNLDRLPKEGAGFPRVCTPGVVSAPSPAALMTGRYGIHNGVVANNDDLPTEEITIAEAL